MIIDMSSLTTALSWIIAETGHGRKSRGIMNIDIGLAVVIVAALIFYLRLIIIQRERVRRMARTIDIGGKKSNKSKEQPAGTYPRFSILSRNSRDWVIAGLGALAILAGVLLNANILPMPGLQPYWWIPTALGILVFSWAFKL